MQYRILNDCTYSENEDGEQCQLANFTAEIIKEVRYLDGIATETYLTLTGKGPGNVTYPPVEVSAAEFVSMQWVLRRWGVRPVISSGGSAKDQLRVAIQLHSKPAVETVYKHLGWAVLGGVPTYLHAGGGIRKDGNHPNIRVSLPPELTRFNLASASTEKKQIEAAMTATMMLTALAPPETSWPLFAATFAPLFGPCDFAVHLSGKTGTFKSELMSLWQSHYGPGMDARHLPCSWSSTPNALEAQAYVAKNAAICVDDFVPNGSSYQVRQYQAAADKIFRAQGNQAGRSRLTDMSSLQTTMYPRGIVLSTGEDTPEGHSVRARMLILEMTPGDIKANELTQAQNQRPLYCTTTAAIIRAIANKPPDIRPAARAVRDKILNIGHTRTPPMLGHLAAVVDAVLSLYQTYGMLTQDERDRSMADAYKALIACGNKQASYLETADPSEQFLAWLRTLLGQKHGHIRSLQGGVPKNSDMLGWTSEQSTSEVPQWKSHGPCIGWCDTEADELYLDANSGYAAIKKTAGSDMSLTRQTLYKRLRDDGVLLKSDQGVDQRFTIKITADGHRRTVLCLSLSGILETEEKA